MTLALGWAAFAQSSSPMREGNWEVSMKLNLPGTEGMPAMKQTHCVTAAMLNDPAANVPSGPGSDCKVTDYKLENNVATYKVACTQPMAINGTGELKYAGPDAYTGTLNIDMGGQNIVMTMDAKRLGDCGSK